MPRRRRQINRVWSTVWLAVSAAFVIDIIGDPPATVAGGWARLLAFAAAVVIALIVGAYLGAHTWPERGQALALTLLPRKPRDRRAGKPNGRGKGAIMFLTSRREVRRSPLRRTLEVVAFASSVPVIFIGVVVISTGRAEWLFAFATPLSLITAWAAFVLVPYWVFGRVGLRIADPKLWTVRPASRAYADRLRLSNGVMLIGALGILFNLGLRSGQTGDEAVLSAFLTLTRVVTGVLMTAAFAVAFFARHERGVIKAIEAAALDRGVIDVRDLGDDELLPVGRAAEGAERA